MKLRNQINLYTVALVIVLILLMNFSIYAVFSHLITDNELQRSKAETEKIAVALSEGINTVKPRDLLRAYVPIDGMVQVISEERKPLTTITSVTETGLKDQDVSYHPGETSSIITYKQKKYTLTSLPIIWSDGTVVSLQLTQNIEATEEILSVLRLVLLAVTIIAIIPVILSSQVLSKIIIRPIKAMTETMKDIQESGKFKRLPQERKSKDELYEMGNTFNHMIDLLETNFEKQEQFVSNASHELKTPLTIIESYSDLLKRRGKQRPELFDESVEAIHSEAVRMREMIEQLLLLAKHDEQWTLEMKQTNLNSLVSESAKVFQNAYNRSVLLNSKEELKLVTDEQKLKQILFIFLDNARKYSEDAITITIEKANETPTIRIEDRGIGIPKQDLSKVFDRFYRVDKARSRKQGGTGLGLAMAKELADALGVRIELNSLEGIGTTVTLIFSENSHVHQL
ncbi:sensor histidine kinase [Metabacillus malikii]|uniref:histidine kinase n=1 Tax=Metabacillus malikii TaxID=1504265 RepID=A0ABT9ZHN9_9BACI|nr:ATP-binding protein [Metabacillus malikii]MDQ0231409.1 signal transduction histidine kinase [Metabacillus malikii]